MRLSKQPSYRHTVMRITHHLASDTLKTAVSFDATVTAVTPTSPNL